MQEPDLDEFREECEAFLAEHFAPRRGSGGPFVWGEGSDRVALFDESPLDEVLCRVAEVRTWRALLWKSGFGWITGPREHGGRGLSHAHQQVFDRAARGYIVPSNQPVLISLGMIAPTLLAHATDAVRAHYVPAMQAGEVIACQLFSEPGAGSDLAGVTTRAVRDGAGWTLQGQKVWTSDAHYSDVGLALCRTSDGPRHHDLTAFLVDMKAPGVEVRPLRQMTGGSAFNEVFLDGVAVDDSHRVGDVGGGWQVARTALASERAVMGDVGFGGAGIFDLDRYRQMLRVHGLADDALARQAFARLVIQLRVGRYTRDRVRASTAPGPEASLGKLQLLRSYARVCDLVSTAVGPRLLADDGEWGGFAWNQFLNGVPGWRIAGGTDEVQKNILAERVLGLPR